LKNWPGRNLTGTLEPKGSGYWERKRRVKKRPELGFNPGLGNLKGRPQLRAIAKNANLLIGGNFLITR